VSLAATYSIEMRLLKVFARQGCISALLTLCTSLSRADAQAPSTRLSLRQLEHVRFANGPVQLAGTLFLPGTAGAHVAVVIVHGSGPNEGDAYRVYAEHFADAGIAALVYDKRGSGASSGDWRHRTLEELAGDAGAAIRFLRGRADIDPARVGVWGISQGSWVIAKLAAQTPEVGFVIGVAADGVSPMQQELYHKDMIFVNLGYPTQARESALKFWRLIFDWLVLVADGEFPLPHGFMEAQLSGAYFGLTYDPIPDWERVRQPTLIVYGEHDQLTPVRESIARLCRAFARAGNGAASIVVVPGALHNITLGTNGLTFPWDTGFAPGYFDSMNAWILKGGNSPTLSPEGRNCTQPLSPDFSPSGRYGALTWFGRARPQLSVFLLFIIVFAAGFIAWPFSIAAELSSRRSLDDANSQLRRLQAHLAGIASLTNLTLVAGFVVVSVQSFFAHGMQYREGSTLTSWWAPLRMVGTASLLLAILLTSLLLRSHALGARRRLLHVFVGAAAVLFIPWLWYWNLLAR
jgi:uncharacterized protein